MDHIIKEPVRFGPFCLHSDARLLERGGQEVVLGGRALELLIALVERAGQVVTKRELMARVWDGITIDEGSLRFQITSLRKALGDGVDGARYISNVSGRGYCFVAAVNGVEMAPVPFTIEPARLRRQRLLRPPVSMIGRDVVVEQIAADLRNHRFITIHGPGGIGKTTVATSVGSTLASEFDGNVIFLDLSTLTDPTLVAGALASALGLLVDTRDSVPAILAFLQEMRALIVFDSCEHVIDPAAALGEAVYEAAPGVAILATSREPLRALGEHVVHLTPLDLPPADKHVSVSALNDYPAARLFVERAAAAGLKVELSDSDAELIIEMCRALDGMPLAIEIAASRAGQHGLAETARLLDGHFRLLWRGRRSAMPRHQTLYETLAWSFKLLSEREQIALERLSIFPGFFTVEAGRSIMHDCPVLGDFIGEVLEDIVAKSMISVHPDGATTRYRLLDTTRAFAHAKLVERGSRADVALRHARYVADQLGKFDINGMALVGETVAGTDLLGDMRAALPWAFSEEGDRETALSIAAYCGRFLIPLSLFDEAVRWTEMAMSLLTEDERSGRLAMDLDAGYGAVLIMIQADGDRARAAIERALVIARDLQDARIEYRLTYCLQLLHINSGEFNHLMPLAQRLEQLSAIINEPHCATSTVQMIATAYALTGDQPLAQKLFEQVIKERQTSDPVSPSDYAFVGDPWIGLSITLWLRGFPDQAIQAAKLISTDFPSVLFSCMGLASAAIIFREIGDPASADQVGAKLQEKARRYSMVPYQAVALGFAGQTLLEKGCFIEAIDHLAHALSQLRAREYGVYGAIFARSLVRAYSEMDRAEEARAIVEARIDQIKSIGGSYDLPEWLRIRAEIEFHDGAVGLAEANYLEAIELAHMQGALSWELRAELGLARLFLEKGKNIEAGQRLEAVLSRFNEGFATHDLISASHLIEELGQVCA